MEEEIELREYLNVLWKNRLLILAVALVSLISSGIFSFVVLQDEYLSEAKLSYTSNEQISLHDTVEILKSQTIIQNTAVNVGEKSQKEALSTLINLRVENIKDTNSILLKLNSNNPEKINKYFNEYIKVAITEVNIRYNEKSQLEYSKLENSTVFYTNQRTEINEKLKIKMVEEADLEINRLKSLNDTLAKYSKWDRQLDIELKINDFELIKEDKAPFAIKQQAISSNQEFIILSTLLTSLDNKLIDLENQAFEMDYSDSKIVELQTPPTVPSVKPPKRALNITIATVFGLFLGVFIAFFKNYMEESQQ